jgi:hypothetical protein
MTSHCENGRTGATILEMQLTETKNSSQPKGRALLWGSMRARTILAFAAVLALSSVARPAVASVNLGLGADWMEGGVGEFNLTLGVDTSLARHLSLGGRAGAAFFEDSHHVGIPIDLELKLHIQRIYFEGLVGPWVLLDAGDRFQFHGAFGFGLESGSLSFGLEVGRLAHSTMVGLRLGFRL